MRPDSGGKYEISGCAARAVRKAYGFPFTASLIPSEATPRARQGTALPNGKSKARRKGIAFPHSEAAEPLRSNGSILNSPH
jgi:hypothetical protein